MYTTRADRPINPVIREILAAIRTLVSRLDYDYILVGATARDILMTHVFGLQPRRATHDVDFAIALQDWDGFHQLKTELLETGDFAPSESRAHLLYYKPDEHGKAFPLDVLPFGGVEQEAHQIAWPPDMSVVMNVTAYSEALKCALQVDLGGDLIVPVVSIPALAALKLLAWNDRGLIDNKDANDLFFLLQHYADAGNHDRLYEEAFDVLEGCEFDLRSAGAVLLGYDVALCLGEESRRSLFAVLADPQKRDRLIVHMTRSAGTEALIATRLVADFERGLNRKSL